MSFQFHTLSEEILGFYDQAAELLQNDDKNAEVRPLLQQLEQFMEEYYKQPHLTLAFVGQYNAGKSTTIAALTGASFKRKERVETQDGTRNVMVYEAGEKDIKIGAQILTDRTEQYVWNDVLLIDTPGIYAGRNDHNEVTLDQISKSDLLVFVVSNELFNPQGGAFFRKLAFDLQRQGQMLLIVNKMARESGSSETLTKSLLEVMEPSHPDDFHTCFIDSDSYLAAQTEEDEEEKVYLLDKSNFNQLWEGLQALTEKNRYTAKLATPLNRLIDILDQAYNLSATATPLNRNMLELLRRKSLILRSSEVRLANHYKAELSALEHEVLMEGEKVATLVDGHHKSEDINKAIQTSERTIEMKSKESLDKISKMIEEEFSRLQGELEQLDNSELGNIVRRQIEAEWAKNKKSIQERDVDTKNSIKWLNKGPQALEKLGGMAAKVSKDTVYNLVKMFGGKFKPWGATKATKFINKLGPVLSVIGVALDVFLTLKGEKDEEDQVQKLRLARTDIRQEYRTIAQIMTNEYEFGITKEVKSFYDTEIKEIETLRKEITDGENRITNLTVGIEALVKRAKARLRMVK